ncbi:PfkB family carbohydrate kinase [Nocardia sp. NPDC059691]|uniref:PfkB family carbohydrate kinase n=1 Tax=Nocardia sp. NPDC059691 TaxID=3346908 RepID=UPI0036A48A40
MTIASEHSSGAATNDVEVDRITALTTALGYMDVERVRSWGRILADRLQQGGRVLGVGNGGSAAQAQHLVAELVGRFESERTPLAAMALTTDSAVVTAVANDYGFDEVYARQVRAHGREGDVLVAFSRSGCSANVLAATVEANGLGMLTLAVTGPFGSPLARAFDEVVSVEWPTTSTIQECHLLITHELCGAVDSALTSKTQQPVPIEPPTYGTAPPRRFGHLVVVGDALADCDWSGEVTRVSPEAPVPVLSGLARQWRPGGAGLAAMLAASDGWSVTMVAAFGDDEPGQRIRAELAAAGVSLIELASDGPTSVKLRMRARGQTLLMVDDSAPVTAVGEPPADVARALAAADGILVTDYGRGVAAQPQLRALLAAVTGRVPVVWDPHRHGPAPIPRVSVVVPNQHEAAWLANDDIVGNDLDTDVRRARNLRARWRCDHAVVTRGADGAVLVGGDTEPAQVFPAPRREHGDACGAGDRFAVTLLEQLIGVRIPSTAVQQAVIVAADQVGGAITPGSRCGSGREVVIPAATYLHHVWFTSPGA